MQVCCVNLVAKRPSAMDVHVPDEYRGMRFVYRVDPDNLAE